MTYDSQNGFGALLRGCSYVPFQEDGSTIYHKPNIDLLPCSLRSALDDETIFQTIVDLQLQ
jgi:hypothetical protein